MKGDNLNIHLRLILRPANSDLMQKVLPVYSGSSTSKIVFFLVMDETG